MGVGWGGRWFVGCHGGGVENEERKLKGERRGRGIYEGGRKEFLEVAWSQKRTQALK